MPPLLRRNGLQAMGVGDYDLDMAFQEPLIQRINNEANFRFPGILSCLGYVSLVTEVS